MPDDVADEIVPSPEPPRPAFDGQAPPPRYDRVTIRAITVAIVLSLFVHLALLFLPIFNRIDQQLKAPADEIGPLSVTIAQSKPQPPAPVSPDRTFTSMAAFADAVEASRPAG